MPRHVVCLTFDHDHLSGFIARGLTSPTAMSRGEYDIVVIPRLVALLEKYGIKATFFTPGHTIDSSPEAVTPYVEAGHELAHHGWTHRLPVQNSASDRCSSVGVTQTPTAQAVPSGSMLTSWS